MEDLVRLSAGRWLMPLLALAGERGGLRFAEAVRRLGLSRGIARSSLDALVEGGWLVRNTGHGHPLRPEYLLTERGRERSRWCERVLLVRDQVGLAPETLTRWTLPLISELAPGEARFSGLKAALRPVSPRALSLTLKSAIGLGLIDRRLEESFPPKPFYALAARGQPLAEAMANCPGPTADDNDGSFPDRTVT